uniref:adenosylcobinamide-phosphate synthase CbiB n=1 Tax=Cyanobium sp. TaxID=2164130 RepID=UPI0040489218
MQGWLLVALACGVDRLIGDPRWCLHPVVVMGWLISSLRQVVETLAGDRPWALRLGGGVITLVLVVGSGGLGWGIEHLAMASRGPIQAIAWLALLIALASALAGKSLEQGVQAVLDQRDDLPEARLKLSWIVGRDTANLDRSAILRALAETASENGVDGLFAPLFWMLVGAGLWAINPAWIGPLSLAWAFKAASTLDSMLGYRRGKLVWLGTAGARLDDLLVWLPCRLVALSLPLASGQSLGKALAMCWPTLQTALKEGAADPSPNAGVSQAAYALVGQVQLGGANHYGGQIKVKPILGAGLGGPDPAAIGQLLAMGQRLEQIWLVGAALLLAAGAMTTAALEPFITKILS